MIQNRLQRPARFHSLVVGLGVCAVFGAGFGPGVVSLTAQESGSSASIAEHLDVEIPALMEAGEVPGLSAALVRDGELVWSGAFGVQDSETGEPVTSRTIFQAASLTKQLLAYTALRLADRGVFDLDTPLADYLPYERLEN